MPFAELNSFQPSVLVILSSYVVDLDLRASPQRRGNVISYPSLEDFLR